MGGLHTHPPLVRSRASLAYTPHPHPLRIRVCGGLDSALQASDASRVFTLQSLQERCWFPWGPACLSHIKTNFFPE